MKGGSTAGGYLGVFDSTTAEFTEWQMPSAASSRVHGMAKDTSDTIWFGADTNTIGRVMVAPGRGS